jgi:hypothetical protein
LVRVQVQEQAKGHLVRELVRVQELAQVRVQVQELAQVRVQV